MGGWSFLISPQIGCSIISNVIKISWGRHGQGKRILMLGHSFLFVASYHTNDEWNHSAVYSGCRVVSKWEAGIPLRSIRGFGPRKLPVFRVHPVFKTQEFLAHRWAAWWMGWLIPTCCHSDPYMMLEACFHHPHQQYLCWCVVCFLQFPFLLCHSCPWEKLLCTFWVSATALSVPHWLLRAWKALPPPSHFYTPWSSCLMALHCPLLREAQDWGGGWSDH